MLIRVLRNPAIRALLVVVLVVEAGVAVWIGRAERTSLRALQKGTTSKTAPREPWVQVDVPGVSHPTIASAEEAHLDGSESVIGVQTGGKARAYRVSALTDRSRHIINDLLGGNPVSVTYCDISDCVQVYTQPGGAEPLDVRVGGLFVDRGMVVRLQGEYFLQSTNLPVRPEAHDAAIPFKTLPAKRCTWDEWRRLHPDTDIYVGERPR